MDAGEFIFKLCHPDRGKTDWTMMSIEYETRARRRLLCHLALLCIPTLFHSTVLTLSLNPYHML